MKTHDTKKTFYNLAIATLFTLGCSDSNADTSTGIEGTWQTKKRDAGYIHVSFAPCADKLCATIIAAFNSKDQKSDDYKHLGKQMIWDMQKTSDSSWSGGKIWDPTKDKTYKSKMTVDGNDLTVSGCIAFICKTEQWVRVP